MLTKPFKEAIPIIETIEKQNHQAYFVGGCVRDLLLQRPLGDIDIATSAVPNEVMQMFDKVIPVGLEHGTVIVRHAHHSYEVTTFRIDGEYTDKRHPDAVTFINQINKDLERRDFTINALAMNKDGEILDLFGGKEDINNRLIRTVGNGYDRFLEDPLRILRALRFSSQLGFHIHPETLKDMKRLKAEIKTVAVERITNEFEKFFAGDFICNGLSYFKESGIDEYLPIISKEEKLIDRIPDSIVPLKSFGEVISLFHILQPEIGIKEWTRAWKCSKQTENEATELVWAYNYYRNNGVDNWLLYRLNSLFFKGFERLCVTFQISDFSHGQMLEKKNSLAIMSKRDLSINGNDLMQLFPHKERGRWIAELLNEVEKQVVFGKLNNNNKEIKEWIEWNPPETN